MPNAKDLKPGDFVRFRYGTSVDIFYIKENNAIEGHLILTSTNWPTSSGIKLTYSDIESRGLIFIRHGKRGFLRRIISNITTLVPLYS